MAEKIRCGWCLGSPEMVRYHDEEWGRPVHDDRKLFEFLILEGAQAGLSWATILKRREGYRVAFDQFDAEKIARYDARKIEALRADARIIRNRLKIEGTVKNARAFLAVQAECGSFDAFLWGMVGGKPQVNRPRIQGDVPAQTKTSDVLSKALKARGFTFVGSTICYAFMQAVGMVDDHVEGCFRAGSPGKGVRRKAR
ncbi:MAG: DNA-3-methyladenine glycosylase I [Opitutales bacterium]|jgi:DNA-3-methyladenine glycosylase I